MRRQLWLLSFIVVLVALGLGLYLRLTATPGPKALAVPAREKGPEVVVERFPVKTALAERRDLEVTLTVFGAINYLDKVEVASEVTGVLKQVPVQPGDLVAKGQVVAVLDTDLLQTELKAKAAQKAQAQVQLQLAAWQYQSQQKVFKAGGISLNDFEEAEAKYREKQAEVARYAAEMAQTQTQIRKATITAPVSAIVGLRSYNLGERWNFQSEKGIVTLMQIDEVYGEAEVNERDLARLKVGQEAVVYPDAFSQTPFRGKITRLEPVLKQESRTMIAKIRLANPQLLLRPGMFARMEIVLDKVPQVVAIPTAALRQAPDKSFQVFVVSDEVAFLRKVIAGLSTPNWTEIKEGIQPGEAVVVEGGERLRDLSRVISTPVAQP
jgi:RND family efflux transporter MFP subunit